MEGALTNIQINCFNCRGLRNHLKIKNIFSWLKTSHLGICLIQESHSVVTDEQKWGGKIFYSHGDFNARGVAILIPKYLENSFEYVESHKDNTGRLLVIKCKIEENTFILVNVYFPTKDDYRAQCSFLNTHTPHSIRAAVMVSLGLNHQLEWPLMLTIGADCTHS